MPDAETFQERAPGLRLGRRGLTLLLVGVVTVPTVSVALLTLLTTRAADHPLPVEIRLTEDEAGETAVRISNAGDDELASVRIALNDAFYYMPRQRLDVGGEMVVPLTWFAKKSGHRFDPETIEPELVTVTARLPGNRRGVVHQEVGGRK
ncbi:hypothetical protein Mal4_55320 [Maioricimonas rarisocia]|uniref:Uncharacterized protein n=1 Tax=Maioricimonas rarisocia TaxID=2528026 RepID=A0A517ZF97_9PLAN|nr:hypothetical protein [Maioricimonas rarisocia]QDU41167.1 hypothetical protein Mal4_55320 [Maioricimonas rarisocia]